MFNGHTDTVSYLKTAFLAQVLDSLDKLAGNAFLFQLLRNLDIQCNCKASFIGNGPSGNVLAEDFHIFAFDANFLPFCQAHSHTSLFQLSDFFLRQSLDCRADALHQFSELLSHCSEVTLDLLDQNSLSVHKLKFFHIHFFQDEMLHGNDALLLGSICGRNGNALQRLTHNDVFFLAQTQHHAGYLLGKLHAKFLFPVNTGFICNGEFAQVYALVVTARCLAQITVQTVRKVRRDGSHQFGDSFQTGIESLVCAQLVCAHG